jgi:hypothetical protein
MAAAQLQALLRFLSHDAKIPLAMAMAKTKQLQNANLTRCVDMNLLVRNDPNVFPYKTSMYKYEMTEEAGGALRDVPCAIHRE